MAKDDDVAGLIARKQYARAIEVIRAQLQAGRPDPRLRMQLADVLVLAGREREGVMILVALADEFAKEGFAAKAIAVLKKIQKLDPGRRDIEAKLATLIETKQKEAATLIPIVPPPGMPEIGMEEIGFEPPPGGPVAVPAERSPSPPVTFAIEEAEPAPEMGFSLGPADAPALAPASAARPSPAPVEDRDLLLGNDGGGDAFLEGLEPLAEAEPGLDLELETLDGAPAAEGAPAPAKPVVDGTFANELLLVIDELFPSGMIADVATGEARPGEVPPGGTQIVVSPLFKDFSVDEMVAVIQGLRLLTCAPRKIILRQGDPGDSLYMLTSGRVRAFVKNAQGKQAPLADLAEGAFFGEMSILTGKPRSASIVAVTDCELLELDRATLDRIVASHPHVMDVLKEFARARSRAR
jgi:CRP-like cAMP-binding protein